MVTERVKGPVLISIGHNISVHSEISASGVYSVVFSNDTDFLQK